MTYRHGSFGPRRVDALRRAQLAPSHPITPGQHALKTKQTPSGRWFAYCTCGEYATKAYADVQKALTNGAQHVRPRGAVRRAA